MIEMRNHATSETSIRGKLAMRREILSRRDPSSSRSVNGFTLIELLVVITILGILMSLGVSGASAIRNQAKNAQARNDCAGLSTAIKAFYSDYSRYPTARRA